MMFLVCATFLHSGHNSTPLQTLVQLAPVHHGDTSQGSSTASSIIQYVIWSSEYFLVRPLLDAAAPRSQARNPVVSADTGAQGKLLINFTCLTCLLMSI